MQDLIEVPRQRAALRSIQPRHFAVTEYSGEDVVEVVRHPAGQCAQGFELARARELSLQALRVGGAFAFARDVEGHSRYTHGASGIVARSGTTQAYPVT